MGRILCSKSSILYTSLLPRGWRDSMDARTSRHAIWKSACCQGWEILQNNNRIHGLPPQQPKICTHKQTRYSSIRVAPAATNKMTIKLTIPSDNPDSVAMLSKQTIATRLCRYCTFVNFMAPVRLPNMMILCDDAAGWCRLYLPTRAGTGYLSHSTRRDNSRIRQDQSWRDDCCCTGIEDKNSWIWYFIQKSIIIIRYTCAHDPFKQYRLGGMRLSWRENLAANWLDRNGRQLVPKTCKRTQNILWRVKYCVGTIM